MSCTLSISITDFVAQQGNSYVTYDLSATGDPGDGQYSFCVQWTATLNGATVSSQCNDNSGNCGAQLTDVNDTFSLQGPLPGSGNTYTITATFYAGTCASKGIVIAHGVDQLPGD